MTTKIPEKQRALVLQGGGALGAYEVGVLKALFQKLKKEDDDDKDKPLFDIIAGTSIGAINAAILVSYVTKKKNDNPNLTPKECWEGSIEKLEEFWRYISEPTPINAKLISTSWWWQNRLYNNKDIASNEAARRYYSTKQFFTTGVEKVFTSPNIIYDTKFFDNFPYSPPNNVWYRYDNTPLRESVKLLVGENFPLKTRPYNSNNNDNNSAVEGPRLLVVSVDVEDANAVTFDSYGKMDKENDNKNYEWKTKYGQKNEERVIRYNDGVTLDHVMASATIPLTYDYQLIEGRKYWDGGLLSNTPLRELIGRHKSFWEDEIDPKELEKGMWKTDTNMSLLDEIKGIKVPDLEVYIISVWQSKETNLPSDHDGVKDRYNDIRYSDKTKYDEKVALLVSDYLELSKQIRNIAINNFKNNNEKEKFERELDHFLKNTNTKSTLRSGEERKYDALIRGSFEITNVIRIERQDNSDNISSKFADFTSETIEDLIKQGEKDTLNTFKKIRE